MKRLYVRLAGDNDFWKTVEAFVMAIAPHVLEGGKWAGITKEQIVALFNEHAFSLYALHQCHNLTPEPNLRNHFPISTKDVYFDEEIDEFSNYNGDGCMACILHDETIGYYPMM